MKAHFESYGQYSSSNYGVNAMVFVDPNNNKFYFSYKTLVAFWTSKTGLVCIQNYWGTTTGKHLNWIEPDKSKRVDRVTFNNLYAQEFGG